MQVIANHKITFPSTNWEAGNDAMRKLTDKGLTVIMIANGDTSTIKVSASLTDLTMREMLDIMYALNDEVQS